jgi:hypothetical protein
MRKRSSMQRAATETSQVSSSVCVGRAPAYGQRTVRRIDQGDATAIVKVT